MTLPNKSTLFKNNIRDSDDRGEILSVIDETIKNVSIISCNACSIRSNHYHHNDFHFMYVLEGEIDYFFIDNETKDIEYIKVKVGETIFTPKNEIHSTYFPKKTKMVVGSKFSRDKETYETDTVRVSFVTLENIKDMLKRYGD